MENEPSLKFSSCPEVEPYYWLNLHKGKTLVGRCRLGFIFGKCYLGWVIIYKRFRRKGYGDILIREAVKDNPTMALWVLPTNVSARRLYEKNGFVKVGMLIGRGVMMLRKPDAPIRFEIEVGKSLTLKE